MERKSAMRGKPGDDEARRRRQPLARMAAADPALDAVYRYWRSRRDDGLLPRRARIDMARLAPATGHVDVLHVAGRHPALRFRLHGTLVWLDRVPVAADDFASVAWLGTPLYERVARGHGRLVLPLSEDGRRVSALAVCTSAPDA